MERTASKLLIFGIGNVGRSDDGAGIRVIERLESETLPEWVRLEANYQLNAEDALLVSEFDKVIFVDASAATSSEDTSLGLRRLQPDGKISFSTHAMSIEAVLALCSELYRKVPEAFLLALPGYEWSIGESMSEKSRRNVDQAVEILLSCLNDADTSSRLSGLSHACLTFDSCVERSSRR